MDIPRLLEILACPVCHSYLEFRETGQKRGFFCPKCQAVFPIKDEIPIMLPDAAVPLEQWDNEDKS